MHDADISRTTNGQGMIGEYNFETLRTFSAGKGFGPEYTKEKIPSLEEVLNLVEGKATLLIEVKSGNQLYSGLEAKLIDLISSHQAESWCIVISFHDEVLEKMHKLNPDIRLIKLMFGRFPGLNWGVDHRFNRLDFEEYEYVEGFGMASYFARPGLLREVHRLGKSFFVYTLNDSADLKRFAHMGADGLITDRPELAVRIFE